MQLKKLSLSAFLACGVSISAIAQEAHVHGSWESFAALEDGKLTITLSGPLVDVLGYEHAPASEKEHKQLHQFEMNLAKAGLMVTPAAAADCVAAKPVLVLPEKYQKALDEHKEHHDHGDHDHGDHDHGDHDHDDHDHDEHDHGEHDHGEHDHDEHDHQADADITYVWSCASAAKLSAISYGLFSAYPAIKQVDAVFLGDDGQKAQRLTAKTSTFSLK